MSTTDNSDETIRRARSADLGAHIGTGARVTKRLVEQAEWLQNDNADGIWTSELLALWQLVRLISTQVEACGMGVVDANEPDIPF